MNIAPMADGRKLPSGAVFGASAIVAALLLWGAFSLGLSQATYSLKDKDYSERQAAATRPRIQRECAILRGPALAKCADEIVDARDQRDRDQQNLDTQRKVADRTTWFLVLGLIELSLTLYGILVLKDQLAATREAIANSGEANNAMREANRIAREEIRPYLLFVGARLEEASESRSHFFRVVVVLKNDGARPAVIKSRECGAEQPTGNPVPLVAQDEISFLKAGDIVGRQSEGAIAFRVYKSHIFPWREPGPPGRAEIPKMVRFRATMKVSYRGITDPEEVTYETEIHVNVQLSATSEIRSEVETYNRREIYR